MKLRSMTYLLVLLSIWGCREYHTISSPDGSECLTFVTQEDLSTEANDIYLYYGSHINQKEYARMKWSNMTGVTVYWGTRPLIIRTVVMIKENTIPSKLVDIKRYYEEEESKLDTIKYISYDFPSIVNDKYNKCK